MIKEDGSLFTGLFWGVMFSNPALDFIIRVEKAVEERYWLIYSGTAVNKDLSTKMLDYLKNGSIVPNSRLII
ncbi:hypothetical protein [Rossellomorea sp. DUT-2]|uniref:hypothetical protein n=1 Tax=Rossellomorea sp. DUT-2 TaxID=3412021 RepID=UPI003D180257